MPSYFPTAYGRQLPLSPPEYHATGVIGRSLDLAPNGQLPYEPSMHFMMPPVKEPHPALEPCRHLPPYHAYHEQAPPPPHPVPVASDRDAGHGPTRAPIIYHPILQPIAPPARPKAGAPPDTVVTAPRAPADPAPVEEKAAGGVSAVLDYGLDQMTDFVAETAQGMYDLYASKLHLADVDVVRSVQPGSVVAPAFRKFVSQVLSSTRLPSATILLALVYLAERMTALSSQREHRTSRGLVYRMLVTALLLASKFLDDNTFQNRSWSDVSGLPVAELNALEIEWLRAIDWTLVVASDHDSTYRAVADRWQAASRRATALAAAAARLPPLDTSRPERAGPGPERSPPRPSASRTTYGHGPRPPYHLPFPAPAPAHATMPAYDPHGWAYAHGRGDYGRVEYSPPSAPETGPNTPSYPTYPNTAWHGNGPTPPYTFRPAMPAPQHLASYHYPSSHQLHPPPPPPPPSVPAPPYYPPHSIWNGHAAGCACAYCVRPHESYLMPPVYAS
ncbi:MAG: hypothetical protein M1826_004834 [Phylliscum demangeonii]|nr:MAG: hypothetical protein M1826_004834 [Phylliscum demangeonii]